MHLLDAARRAQAACQIQGRDRSYPVFRSIVAAVSARCRDSGRPTCVTRRHSSGEDGIRRGFEAVRRWRGRRRVVLVAVPVRMHGVFPEWAEPAGSLAAAHGRRRNRPMRSSSRPLCRLESDDHSNRRDVGWSGVAAVVPARHGSPPPCRPAAGWLVPALPVRCPASYDDGDIA